MWLCAVVNGLWRTVALDYLGGPLGSGTAAAWRILTADGATSSFWADTIRLRDNRAINLGNANDLSAESDGANILVENDVPIRISAVPDGANYTQIATDGAITYAGSAKRHLSMRPAFVAGRTGGVSKPTMIAVGAFGTYSMPIFAADDEELYWRLQVPGRWDGSSNIIYHLVCALAGAEDVNDNFRMQLSWAFTDGETGTFPVATNDTYDDATMTAGHTAQYSVFHLEFTIDWDLPAVDVAVGGVLAGRVRRVASLGVEIAGEVLVLDHWLNFQIDKVYKA